MRKGKITRRQFVKRATVIGLSLPAMRAVVAACSSPPPAATGAASASAGAGEGSAGASSAPPTGGSIKWPSSGRSLDPVLMQDLGTYGIIAQCFEYLCTLSDNDIAGGLAESWEPNEDGSVWTFTLRRV